MGKEDLDLPLVSFQLPVQFTFSCWLVTALVNNGVSCLCYLWLWNSKARASALLSQIHVDMQFDSKRRTWADCPQLPISLPTVWRNLESWNNPIGYWINSSWVAFAQVRVLLSLSFCMSVGNKIQFAGILEGVWCISSTEMVWILSLKLLFVYCHLSWSVVKTVLWGYSLILSL